MIAICGLTPELSRAALRPWASETQWYLHEAAKRARLERIVRRLLPLLVCTNLPKEAKAGARQAYWETNDPAESVIRKCPNKRNTDTYGQADSKNQPPRKN